jgi:hypothetical protein
VVYYAFVGGFQATTPFAKILGLNAAVDRVFYYQYPSTFCGTACNSVPLHLERTSFPTVRSRALNLSTRGNVGTGDDSLIGGFIVTGNGSQVVLLRALGRSLTSSGISHAVADPMLTLYDSSGEVVATNDDWQTDPAVSQIVADGLAPGDPAEAATIQTLAPGAYTFVVTGKDSTPGLGLVEAYDLSPPSSTRLANISTRGSVGTGDDVLISGFILGDVDSNTVVIRALGPSLAAAGISDPLADPVLTVYDSNGAAIASSDNWQDDESAANIEQNGLAPTDAAESATILHLPAGTYTAIVTGADGATGVGLAEVFDLSAPPMTQR